MRLYDNDTYRDEFMAIVYDLLSDDPTNDRANQIIDAFDSAPEVEAELVKHGRWDDVGGGYVACSECGEEHCWDEYRASYCDTCGAKMDLGDENGKADL